MKTPDDSLALKPVTVFVALLAATGAFAYDFDVSLSLEDGEDNPDPTLGLDVQYFFRPIHHGSGAPWDEIGFIERIGRLQGATRYTKHSQTLTLGDGSADPLEIQTETEVQSVGGRLLYREPGSPHVFSAALDYTELTFEYVRSWEHWYEPITDGSTIGFPGYSERDYVITENSRDSFRVGFGYERYLDQLWTAGASVSYGENFISDDSYSVEVGTRRLWDLGRGRWAGAAASLGRDFGDSFVAESWFVNLLGKYYFNPKTGLRGGVEYHEVSGTINYQLGISRYLNDFIYVRLQGELYKYNVDLLNDAPPGIEPIDERTTFRIAIGGRL